MDKFTIVLFILVGVTLINSRNILVGHILAISITSLGVKMGILPDTYNIIMCMFIVYVISVATFFIYAILNMLGDVIYYRMSPDIDDIKQTLLIGFIPMLNMAFLRDDNL